MFCETGLIGNVDSQFLALKNPDEDGEHFDDTICDLDLSEENELQFSAYCFQEKLCEFDF